MSSSLGRRISGVGHGLGVREVFFGANFADVAGRGVEVTFVGLEGGVGVVACCTCRNDMHMRRL